MDVKYVKLFNPGPVGVHPDLLKAMSVPMFSHRGSEYFALHREVREKLRAFLGTKFATFLFTSSSTGAMEAAMRNLVRERVLVCTCGAFSERWHTIAQTNGKDAHLLQVEWGKAIKPEMIAAAMKERRYDTVAVVHNETSTGVMNPLREIAQVVKSQPDTMLTVDAVSSLAGVPIDIDGWGIDFIFAGVQKAFGLPPGLTVAVASPAALERAAKVKDRGYYFDLVKYGEVDQKDQTPETPSISHIYALGAMLDRVAAEGREKRFDRMRQMAERCRAWAKARYALFPEPGYESVTLTTITNTRGTDIGKVNVELRKRGMQIAAGYGKIKEKTFRIAHMADILPVDLDTVLAAIDEIVGMKG